MIAALISLQLTYVDLYNHEWRKFILQFIMNDVWLRHASQTSLSQFNTGRVKIRFHVALENGSLYPVKMTKMVYVQYIKGFC